MKKYGIAVVFMMVSVILLNCTPMKVNINYDKEVNFAKYNTFHFVKRKPMREKETAKMLIKDAFFLKEASREIRSVLSQKGYRYVSNSKQSDFLVAFYATAKNKAKVVPPTYRIGRFGRRWVTPGHVRHYKQGTLIIDIVDKTKRELVWRGIGSGVLNRENPTQNLLKSVEKVMQKFPPD